MNDAQLIDPFLEARWNIPMTLAWIETGNVEEVRKLSDAWRAGHEAGPATLLEMALAAAEGGGPATTRALWLLRQELAAGGIIATGQTSTGRRVAIPDDEWPDMSQEGEVGPLRDRWRTGQGEYYWDVRVRRSDVLRLWPAKLQVVANSEHVSLPPEADQNPPASLSSSQMPFPKRRGRKPKFHWEKARLHFAKVFEERGTPMPGDKGWENQSDLEKAVIAWFGGYGLDASVSIVRQHVSTWLAEIEAGQKNH